MSKFCENCGSELNDTDTQCPNCGAAVTEKTAKKEVKQTVNNTTKATPSGDKKTFAIIGIAAAAVILVVLLLAIALGGGYKKPLKSYFNGIQKTNATTYLKAYPSFMKDDIEDYYDKDRLEKMMDSMEDEYGDKIKITYKVVDKIKMDKDELEDVKDDLEDDYEDEKIKVTAGYTVCVKITVKGSDDSETRFTTFDIYKINGKWCMID